MIIPLRDMILVEPIEVKDTVTAGGLTIAGSLNDSQWQSGIVKAVGSLASTVLENRIVSGDTIVYAKGGILSISVPGCESKLVSCNNVVAKIEPNIASVET